MTRSSVPTTAQLGSVFQPAVADGAVLTYRTSIVRPIGAHVAASFPTVTSP
jgi:hypothetical protein